MDKIKTVYAIKYNAIWEVDVVVELAIDYRYSHSCPPAPIYGICNETPQSLKYQADGTGWVEKRQCFSTLEEAISELPNRIGNKKPKAKNLRKKRCRHCGKRFNTLNSWNKHTRYKCTEIHKHKAVGRRHFSLRGPNRSNIGVIIPNQHHLYTPGEFEQKSTSVFAISVPIGGQPDKKSR